MALWSVVYEKAIRDDGSLLFPERLTREFLDSQRKTMGSLFSNQYQNEVIPEDEKKFKKEWLRYFSTYPKNVHTFAFIDPAIGQKDRHDYTGITVASVDCNGHWYLRVANRYRLTPTQIVEKMFELHSRFKLQGLGIEVVAYQEALLYLVSEEMRRRKQVIPVKGVTRTKISKNTRILGLVPRFEWGGISLAQGLTDLEDEYNTFPRGRFDDLLDATASLEDIVFYPEAEKNQMIEKPHSPHDPNYERWMIQQMSKRANSGGQ